VFLPRVLQGLALGALFVPLVAVTLAQIPPSALSDATGIATLVRYLGGNVGIAVLQVIQVRRTVSAADAMSTTATLGHPAIASAVNAFGAEHVRALLAGEIATNAGVVSYLYLFRVSAIIFLCSVPLLLFLPNLRAARTAVPSADVNAELADELDDVTPPDRLQPAT
jgi:hypothetical protein